MSNKLTERFVSRMDVVRSKLGPRTILNYASDLYEDFAPTSKELRVFSGGLRGWGGSITKIQLLQKYFPHYSRRYNIIYALHSRISPEMALKAKKRGVKIVYNASSVFLPAYYRSKYFVLNKYRKEVYDLADYVFYQSQFCKKITKKFLGPCNHGDNSEILYNAVDTSTFIPNNRRFGSGKLKLLAAGSHHYSYSLEVIIHALKLLKRIHPGVKLIIAGKLRRGEGIWDVETRIHSLIEKLGLKESVECTSTYSLTEAPKVYQSADILVHAVWNDVCPNTVIEAMACGLPVVYSNSGGLPELVGQDAGVPFSSKESWDDIQIPDPHEISIAIIKALDNHKTLADGARTRAVELFDVRYWVKRHRHVFNELLSSQY